MISLLIVACNEEHRLAMCIASARRVVDEVVVVVQESADGTLALAKKLADCVVEHPRHGFCEASRADGIAACTQKWILSLDADEWLTPEGGAILHALTENGDDFFRLRRLTIVGDKTLEDASHARFFRRDRVTSRTTLHTQFEPTPKAKVRTIDHVVMIHHHKSWEEQRLDDMRYSAIQKSIDKRGFWRDFEGHAFDAPLADALADFFSPHASVLDLGCGRGEYVRHLRSRGIPCAGVDGNPMTPVFDSSCAVADLTQPLLLPPADWVLCLEVGEHIPNEYADVLFANIHRHNRVGVVLSWAVLEQGGRGHVNERSNDWVATKMNEMGYFWQDVRKLRAAATLPWFKNTLMAFARYAVSTDNHHS